MLAFPMKGTMWCSQRVKNSMSLTTTISSVSSVNIAFWTTSWTVSVYPLVKYIMALAALMGVSSNPSLVGSSPMCLMTFL